MEAVGTADDAGDFACLGVLDRVDEEGGQAVDVAPITLPGFALVILGAIAVWAAGYAGGAGPAVQWGGYAALAFGWALMLAAIFLRTRYHRQRMRETN
mgnify:CR=1 FL=1